ncbi:phage tail assembly protein [Bradyrhizobium elkanii]|uniref:phage tail assembly protein n=1 Tax=Bradyrhizobium elkanii TaxID=29448 RepID=UPI002729B681|nr:phage tail assembly protein [Bradyrhizobium elkanii]WLA86912.1 phage tail assembly protein [Bradyrhizobium elkanii]
MTDEVKKDMRLSAEITLDFPFDVDGKNYKALTMRRPKTKDSLKAAKFKGHDADKGILLLADLCNVSPDVIAELDEIDAMKLSTQLDAFRGGQSS